MLFSFENLSPVLQQGAWVAETAQVIGDVRLGSNASVWFGSLLRGDINYISIGESSNVQDLCVCHVADEYPCIVGNRCVIGHSVTLHGCTLEDDILVGIGAIILNGAYIGRGSVVAAGTLVPEGKVFPERSLIMGSPAKRIKDVSDELYHSTLHFAEKYTRMKERFQKAGGLVRI